jgi:hypothetical protein
MNSSGIMSWFDSIRISDPFSFNVEITIGVIGIAIAIAIFIKQSKTDEKMNTVIKEIHSFTGRRHIIEVSRNRYYITNIEKDLRYIRY